MQIIFNGAAGTVTGSNYLLKTESESILIDCGMYQGGKELRERNYLDFPYNVEKIDAVLITHAHVDHTGLLPKLVKKGYRGPIYATHATSELINILLHDSERLNGQDLEWENKRRLKNGLNPLKPLFTKEDVNITLGLIKEISLHKELVISHNIKAFFRDAGHIIGSSFIELNINENDINKKIIFSGDIGRSNQAIIKDPETGFDADVVVIESTYGDRLHKIDDDTNKEIVNILQEVIKSKGTLIIPAFSVGRTQEIIYRFFELTEENKMPFIKVFVDSPMSLEVTRIYEENKDLYDDKSLEYIKNGKNPLYIPNIKFISSADDSKTLNDMPGPKIIISASGMCEGGRIRHHLKHNLYKSNTHVMFVGFQGEGTTGRKLVNGAKKVNILGDEVDVNAKIHTIGGLSAHADRNELASWLKFFINKIPKVFITHGEPEASLAFSNYIKENLTISSIIPKRGDIFNFSFKKDDIKVSSIK